MCLGTQFVFMHSRPLKNTSKHSSSVKGARQPRTHDLVMLLAECHTTASDLNILETDCLLLSRYGVVFRYPGPEEEPSEQDGREAIAAAERVQAAIEPLLGEAEDA